MKKSLLILIAIITSASICAQVTITHNNSQAVSPGGITCTSGGVTLNTIHLGVFDLETDFGIAEDWQVLSVEMGVEDADNLLNGEFPVIISAYTTDDNTPNGNLALLGMDTLFVNNEDELGVPSMNFDSPVIVPAGETLLIRLEVFGDGQSQFRYGTTTVASNDETWGYAPPCGFTVAQTFSAQGFSRAQILNVVGESPTGLNEALSQSVTSYPNPTTGHVNIQFPARVEVREVRLYDLLGNEFEAPFTNNSLDIRAHADGIYFLVMHTSQGILRKSIVKQ